MTTITDTITTVQDKVLDALDAVQAPVVDAVRAVVGQVEERLPEDRPAVPFVEQLDPAAIVEANYAFVKQLVDKQHEFAKAIVDAISPLLPAAPKPAPKATTKKAA